MSLLWVSAAREDFETVYRGVDAHPDHIDHNNLGHHWSYNQNDAYNFALGQGEADLTGTRWEGFFGDDEEDPPMPEGSVIKAKVHRRHLIHHEDPEWDHYELTEMPDEVRVRSGAPVHIQEVRHVALDGDGNLSKDDVVPGHPTRGRA